MTLFCFTCFEEFFPYRREEIYFYDILMLLVVDKPLYLSSFDVVKRMKHVFPGQKIGHSGTLDPLATGMMIL